MMASRKAQSKAGIPMKRRGQQMGDERSNNANKLEESRAAETPALRGRRKEANEFYADDSQQAVGGNAARPRSNSPSVSAANPVNVKKGVSNAEGAFKQRQAAKKGRK